MGSPKVYKLDLQTRHPSSKAEEPPSVHVQELVALLPGGAHKEANLMVGTCWLASPEGVQVLAPMGSRFD